jgi:subtilase-type serine protease
MAVLSQWKLRSRLCLPKLTLASAAALTAFGVSAQSSPEAFLTPEFKASWGLGAIGAQYAYAQGYTGLGIKLGIADSPIQLSHPEFAGRIYSPSVFPPFPIAGFEIPDHGTHVMGLASAARNGVGMMGVAYNATLASVLATGEEGYPEPGDWAGELIDAGVSVMNGSFGPPALPPEDLDNGEPNPDYRVVDFQPILDDELFEELSAVRRLAEADVVMVFAAGNEYDEQPTSSQIPSGAAMVPLITPARTKDATLYKILSDGDEYDPETWEYASMADVGDLDGSAYAGTLIAVVAVDQDNDIASFSNRCGAAADWCLSSPGVALYSTVPVSTYAGGLEWSGTSMAAPLVAGGAALVREAFPYMTARQVIEVMLTTATEIGDTSIYGHGLLNLERAVKGPIEFGHPSLVEDNESIFEPIFAVDTKGHDSVWSNDITGIGGFSKAGAGMLTGRWVDCKLGVNSNLWRHVAGHWHGGQHRDGWGAVTGQLGGHVDCRWEPDATRRVNVPIRD